MEEQKYKIGGETYIQRPLTLLQLKQLINLLRGFEIPLQFGPIGIIDALGEKMPFVLAMLLEEEPLFFSRLKAFFRKLLGKNTLTARAGRLEASIILEQTLDIIAHFFVLNPTASLLNQLKELTELIGAMRTMT